MKKLNILLIIAVLFNSVISCSEVIETNDVGYNHEVYEMRVYYTHSGSFMKLSQELSLASISLNETI